MKIKPDGVLRLHNPTQKEFNRATLTRRIPVIFRGVIDTWKALSRWTPDYLLSKAGTAHLYSWALRNRLCHLEDRSDNAITLQEYITKFGRPESADPTRYVGRVSLRTRMPNLMDDIEVPSLLRRSPLDSARNRCEAYFWMGLSPYRFVLHYDLKDNLLAQVQGRKRILLFSPRQRRFLYPHSIFSPRQYLSRIDTVQWDRDRFPAAERAEGVECILETGELLFIPSGWWHQVSGLEPTISVNLWWPPPPSVQLHRHYLYDYGRRMRLLVERSARTVLRMVSRNPSARRFSERTRHAEGGTPHGSGTAR